MSLRLAKLQDSDKKTRKIRAKELKEDWNDEDRVLHHQLLSFLPGIIQTEPISCHHNDPLAGHFGINKSKELIGRKYYWPRFKKDDEAYIRGCVICLHLKVVRHKPYTDLQLLLMPTHQ